MKRFIYRSAGLILILVMLVSLFAGLTVQAASYSYNNGEKGKLCTSLSSSAKSYYGSGYDYATLSALSGTTLEAKLRERMKNGWHGASYDNLKTTFKYTDAYNGSSSSVYCFYSNTSVTSWDREHVWPQSKGTFSTESNSAGSDVIHLRPTDSKVNSTRSNLPYGEVTGGTYQTVYTKAGKVAGYYSPAFYEPLDAVKGDVARTLLYVYTRWEERNLTDVIDSIDLLLKWCEQDPVDEYEMKRNDICQEICGSRNVFIDYPEYCWRVFSKAIPTHMKTPSGSGNTCNNPQYESAITTPATCTTNGIMTYTCKNCGYSYTEIIPSQGHHYVSGTCTVCGKKQADTQYFYTASINSGDEVVIFNPSNSKVMTTASTTYTKDGTTYYRLLGASASVAGTELSTTASNLAVLTVEKSGNNYAFKTSDGKYLTCETSEFLTLSANPKTGTNKWVLEDSGSNGWYIKNTTTYYQDYAKNYAYVEYFYNFTTYGFKGTAGEAAYNMNFYKVQRSASCVHDYQIAAAKAATCTDKGYTSYCCSKCGDSYTTYTDALGHSWDEGKVTTPPTATNTGIKTFTCTRCSAAKTEIIPATGEETCKHPNTHSEHKDATCTENGYDRTVCKDCGTVISEKVINALGHDFGPWSITLAATCTQSGKESRTCARCGVTETKSIPALGHDYHNGFCTHCGQKDPNYKPDSIHCDGGKNCPSRIFNDLKLKTWYHDSVDYVLASGLMNGVSDWEFDPEGTLTRGMLVTILYRLEGCPDVKSLEDMPFDDVTYGAWYTEAIVWAASEGIVNGISETSFAPNAPVTREQIAAIFYRYAGSEKVSGTLLNFVDAFAVSEYAYDPMLWAVNEGIITGSYDRLSPRDNATRAQIAAVLYRYLTK